MASSSDIFLGLILFPVAVLVPVGILLGKVLLINASFLDIRCGKVSATKDNSSANGVGGDNLGKMTSEVAAEAESS